jgi:hypothetical protein
MQREPMQASPPNWYAVADQSPAEGVEQIRQLSDPAPLSQNPLQNVCLMDGHACSIMNPNDGRCEVRRNKFLELSGHARHASHSCGDE